MVIDQRRSRRLCLVVCDLLGMSPDVARDVRSADRAPRSISRSSGCSPRARTPIRARACFAAASGSAGRRRRATSRSCSTAASPRRGRPSPRPSRRSCHCGRQPLPAAVSMNRRGLPYDPTFAVLDARRPDGTTVGTLANVGIHPVALGRALPEGVDRLGRTVPGRGGGGHGRRGDAAPGRRSATSTRPSPTTTTSTATTTTPRPHRPRHWPTPCSRRCGRAHTGHRSGRACRLAHDPRAGRHHAPDCARGPHGRPGGRARRVGPRLGAGRVDPRRSVPRVRRIRARRAAAARCCSPGCHPRGRATCRCRGVRGTRRPSATARSSSPRCTTTCSSIPSPDALYSATRRVGSSLPPGPSQLTV